MYKTINSTHTGWNRMWSLLLVLLANLAHAQHGSQGDIAVLSGGRMTVFAAHSFGLGTGTQPGIIKTARFGANGQGVVIFGQTATYTGELDTKHVDGYVTKAGTVAFDFPVGNGTKIRKIGISAPAVSAQFKAAYWGVNPNIAVAGSTGPALAPFPVANLGAGVTGVSTTEFWELSGASAINVKLTWDAASTPSTLVSGTLANLIVVGYNPTTSKWEKVGTATSTTGVLAGTGDITATAVTPDDYSAFSFGTSAVPVPDLRPLIQMADRSFVKSTAMSKPMIIRVANLVTGTATAGPTMVYLSVGSNFTAALTSAVAGWTFTDAGSGEYELASSSASIAGGSILNLPITLTAKATISKGNYNINVSVGTGAEGGGETNGANNDTGADVSVSVAN